ncbi:MAG: PspC domain-containing protein [Firmicutes bacterium]|uniref:Phage shock protein C (PspC) family protein n=1 Tax=Melghirimyces thermohalophilus TaxID=1236220 RepID=A0A1G6QM49_9BACL|nr:PspC domain-containing protein [Melghirimyces thermohalophilus]MDA8354217.1 PspC domain-containing protein [Bacillota bacterium]SDC92786.1 phage shock protein C (PspC) family protein [Melghirimyces thermohalophilus]
MKKIYRSRSDKKLAGVCAGLARTLGIGPLWVRLGTLLLLIFTGFFPVGLVYILLIWLLPKEPT